MAGLLGISEEAAQKRVSRAVDRLRELFSKRKVTVGAGGLVVLISANAVQSAPIGLAAAISAAIVAGTAVTASAIITATKTIAMTTSCKKFSSPPLSPSSPGPASMKPVRPRNSATKISPSSNSKPR